MPNLPQPDPNQGFSANLNLDQADPSMSQQDLPAPLPDSRGADYYEAQSIKWNTARIVRLSSGKFALFSCYNESAIDLIQVGTIEEIAGLIPTYDECVAWCAARKPTKPTGPRGTAELLADIGL